MAETFVKREMN